METLRDFVGLKKKIRLERNRPNRKLMHGYLVAMEGGLLVLHQFGDFHPDGFVILREEDVVGLRSSEFERLWDRMLEGEGLLGALDTPPELDLSSMKMAILSAAERYPFLAIQCENEHDELIDFYFAKVIEADDDTVTVHCVNGMAEWEDEEQEIEMDEITMVEFDTPYLKTFAKYVEL